jgi:nitrate reductase beta subunit
MSMIKSKGVLPDLNEFRIPIKFLASMLAAGDEAPVEAALVKLLAVRAYRRAQRVDGVDDQNLLDAVGLTAEDARGMHRLLALAHFHERFVIPTTRRERTDSAPYIERGFSGFREMTPASKPKRRTSFHGQSTGVGS